MVEATRGLVGGIPAELLATGGGGSVRPGCLSNGDWVFGRKGSVVGYRPRWMVQPPCVGSGLLQNAGHKGVAARGRHLVVLGAPWGVGWDAARGRKLDWRGWPLPHPRLGNAAYCGSATLDRSPSPPAPPRAFVLWAPSARETNGPAQSPRGCPSVLSSCHFARVPGICQIRSCLLSSLD